MTALHRQPNLMKQLISAQPMTHPWKVDQILYRYYDSGCAEKPSLTEWKVKKLTPSGAWVTEVDQHPMAPLFDDDYGRTKWIGCHTFRRFAHTTKEDALKSWKIRKLKHYRHVKSQYNYLVQVVEYHGLKEKADEWDIEQVAAKPIKIF
jgi:NurA-like 5'-3' nuclease